MIEFLWLGVFVASLLVVVKSAGWFIDAASDLARKLGMSEFLIGITLVSIGTSLPELTTSLFSILEGEASLVVDNILGSNVANILLIIGVSAIVAKKIIIKRDLVDIDLPLLAISQVLFLFSIWDKEVTLFEGVLALALYGIYLHYSAHLHNQHRIKPQYVRHSVFFLVSKILVTLVVLLVSANYTIKGLLGSAEAFGVSFSVLGLTALAFGTSLPELTVSIIAAMRRKYELSIGNVLGSNIFNSAGVIGILSLFNPLPLSAPTFSIGIPFFIAATFLCILSSISRKIYLWEGWMYLIVYVLFVVQLFR
ncbi:MAG: calcium/sodium antiporter [Candidatus Aenigmarchaeota archaeon]|nr:calcium/sodium antiporter [Candidatus Aenigmarchaeota archaeon]